MRTVLQTTTLIALLFMASCQTKQEDTGLIPLTSSSEKAKELYNQAYASMIRMDIGKTGELINKALKEDPSFFMAKYLGLIYQLHLVRDEAAIDKWLQDVIDFKGDLSKGEQLLQQISITQHADQKADVSSLAKEIITLYPKDFWGYYELGTYQEYALKDYSAAIETFKTAAEKSNNPIISYNFLGYNYMSNNQMAEAGAAFDKYIELAPDQANAYNSKGDYFYKVGDYDKAYEYYMKAHNMDSVVFGINGAEMAQMMIDSLKKK
ncbi:MAG TPA: tetratricopeptide repeat protein [Lentimicrobium sp.]|nr:tetratricopeptide repeat protein [Lentimicrobium sp.]